ncbi:sulfatase-like hydrolase/transferase [Coraliomargarita sp. SDUM461004]|uniref:Sulfatase-like hydrolase/transferase n=1 Tax=Thalassobacterium sedimentorum TaxID=3041258 RepID=A0ABU1AL97_9BACT|nr:sulfatase-like hydrolase/transferase [Coraliomargarita sp. SDUM461004]MDQ8195582.1 sulfatase-like hydrolase/transferase [Coraliomargarita sp. SDUM461004]
MPQPNILWICSDQQRFDTLGCYSNRFVQTPVLDALASDGVLFEHAYCQNPVCTPSRASFLTGRYPRTTRCRQNGQSIPAEERLVTKVLADAGYHCGLAGKLHISACHWKHFQHEPRIDDGYHNFHWSHHPAPDWKANEYSQWLAEKGHSYHTPQRKDCPHVNQGMPAALHQTTWCADKTIEFIEAQQHSSQPWLFSVNIFDPHHPFDPPEAYLQRYLDRLDEIPLPNYQESELTSKSPWLSIDHQGAYAGKSGFNYSTMTERDHRLVRAAYWAMCDLIDAQVGRMLEALKRTEQWENTIVIYMSDHGELLGDHGAYLKGPFFYEPSVHVPLIMSWPAGAINGQNCISLVELVDLAPTLIEAAGLHPEPGMQGSSLLPLLQQKAEATSTWRDDIYCEYYNAMNGHKAPPAHATMLRSERYKIVAWHSLDNGELYDLKEDPDELINLWSSPKHGSIKADMLNRLCRRMAWTVDPLPQRQANW